MDINIKHQDNITIIELYGEIDSNTAIDVQDGILPVIEPDSRILLDMSNVTYMSSAGLRTLLLLYRKISENVGKIILYGLREEIQDIMSITGFLDFFTIVDTRKEGIQSLR